MECLVVDGMLWDQFPAAGDRSQGSHSDAFITAALERTQQEGQKSSALARLIRDRAGVETELRLL